MSTDPRADRPTGNEPRTGDVVVVRETHSPVRFTIRQLPNPVQLQAKSRDQALDVACEYGREQQVDVWYSDGDHLSLVACFRTPDFA